MLALYISFLTPTATTHAFLCPKQKYKLRMERKERRENPEYEYIYYNKVKNTAYGALCLPLGLIMSLNGFFNPHLGVFDKVLFSFVGPFTTMASVAMLNNAFHSGPAIVMTPAGIITRENGLTLWEEISKGIVSYSSPYGITLELIDENSIFINCEILNTKIDTFILKMNRFAKLRLMGTTFTMFQANDDNLS